MWRTVKEAEERFFGKIIKYSFILFNILMVWWLIVGMGAASETIQTASSSAEQAGAVIGTGIGAVMIVGFWVFGDIVIVK